ncbi:MAG: O-antigen ligase family protein [Sphingobium sp.]
MNARLIFIIPFVLFAFNAGMVLNMPGANIMEKGAFLAMSMILLLIRPFDKFIMGLLALVIGLILFQGMATTWPGFSWVTLLMSLNQVVIVYVLLAFKPTTQDANILIKTIAAIPILSIILGLLYQAAGIHPLFSTEWASGIHRLQGSLIPAFLSGIALSGSYASTVLLFDRKKPALLLLTIVNLVILLLAGGRTALAVGMLVILAELLFNPNLRRDHKFWMSLSGLALLPALALTAGINVIGRFQTSGDNGRQIMWSFLDTVAARYPYSGIGFGHQMDIVPREVSIRTGSTAAHNDFVRLTTEIGMNGMILFYILLTLAVLRASISRGRITWGAIIAYAGFLLMSYSDNALATPSSFPLLILAVVVGKIRADQYPHRAHIRLWRRFPKVQPG